MRKLIETTAAPAAIGTYSQAIRAGNVVYLSGQIPLDPGTMRLVEGDIGAQVVRIFENMKAVTEASGGSLNHVVKLTVFLLDLAHFDVVNEVMKQYFQEPYPARSLIGVAALPKQAEVEIEAVMAF